MSDKEFWAQAFLEAYKTMLSVKGKHLFTKNASEVNDKINYEIADDCAFCADIADSALDIFKTNMQVLSIEAKKDINKKESSKLSYK